MYIYIYTVSLMTSSFEVDELPYEGEKKGIKWQIYADNGKRQSNFKTLPKINQEYAIY